MISRRLIRVNELIRREIGEALFRLMNENRFDLSAVTVTEVMTSPNLRHARVRVSIRDHQDERATMLALLRRHRVALQDRLNRNLGLKYTPKLSFELDPSIERGDKVLTLLHRIEQESPPEPGADDASDPEAPDSPEAPEDPDDAPEERPV